MMEVQKYIKAHGWGALVENLSIEVKKYDNGLRVCNYNQIESPKMDPVVRECRGLILDEQANVVSRKFDRFFNFGEAGTHDFDFSSSELWEKADGSLCGVYWNPFDSRWEICTRGTAFAESNHVFGLANDGTFRYWILKAMKLTEEQFHECMSDFDKNVTYIMEYVGPENRIVTPYTESQMVFLGARFNESGKEISDFRNIISELNKHNMNIRTPERYEAYTANDVLRLCNELPGLKEGFVAKNLFTGERVKVKNSLYVKLHLTRGNGAPSAKSLMEMVLQNEQSEFLSYFGEYKPFIEPYENAFVKLIEDANQIFEETQHIESQKEFAMKVKDTNVGSVMFIARKNDCSCLHAFDSMTLNQRVEILKKYVKE